MCMVSSPIYWDYSNMEVSLQKLTTYSLVTTSTEASSPSRLLCFCSLTRLNLRKTSSFLEETTSADKLTAFTDSTTSVKIDFQFVCGRNSKMSSTVCPLPPSSTTRFSACTVVYHPSLSLFLSSSKSLGPLRFQRMVCCATCFGLTPRRANQVGVKTIEAYHILSVRLLSRVSWRRMTSILSAVPIRSSRTAMSSSVADS